MLDDIIAERFGAGPDVSVGMRRYATGSGSTVRATLHTVRRGGRVVGHVFEKTSANRPVWSRTTPEALLYERILPHWPFMRPYVCALYGVGRTTLTTTVYTSAALRRAKSAPAAFEAVAALLPEMQSTGAALIESGALDPAAMRALDYYRPAPRRRVHADHPAHVARIARGDMASVLHGREAILLDNLARLAARARKAPRTICHLDLLAGNIAMTRDGPKLIDWGETRIAPAGFDYGDLLAGAVRALPPEGARDFVARSWRALTLRADPGVVDAAYYSLAGGLVRFLAVYHGGRMLPERLELIAELLDPLGCAPATAAELLERPRTGDLAASFDGRG